MYWYFLHVVMKRNIYFIPTDLLERSVAEGLSVRVVPLKPGIITIDVRVRNMGQVKYLLS